MILMIITDENIVPHNKFLDYKVRQNFPTKQFLHYKIIQNIFFFTI